MLIRDAVRIVVYLQCLEKVREKSGCAGWQGVARFNEWCEVWCAAEPLVASASLVGSVVTSPGRFIHLENNFHICWKHSATFFFTEHVSNNIDLCDSFCIPILKTVLEIDMQCEEERSLGKGLYLLKSLVHHHVDVWTVHAGRGGGTKSKE